MILTLEEKEIIDLLRKQAYSCELKANKHGYYDYVLFSLFLDYLYHYKEKE